MGKKAGQRRPGRGRKKPSSRAKIWMLVVSATALVAAALYFLVPPRFQPGIFRSLARIEAPKATTGHEAGFIGSASCAECHTDIADSYSKTAMGRSLYRPTETNIVEDYTSASEFYHEPSQQYFRMSHEGGKFYQARYQRGPDGKPFNELKTEVTYIVGSGNHARSYLHAEPDGKVYQLPVAWYPQDKKWAMNPGYDNGTHKGFSRRITYDCTFCHAAYPTIPAGADRFSYPETSLFADGLKAIDCERCHGPGAEHVKLAGTTDDSDKIKASIINTANLSQEQQLDACMQCHLETTSDKLPHDVYKPGRAIFSYRPNEPLPDYRLAFDHPKGTGHDDKFEIAGQAYRMRMSKCFTESKGKMTCTTCHNPHKVPENRTAAGIVSCKTCHETNDCTEKPELRAKAADNCIQCHMPSRRTDDVVNVVMTDHFIQRKAKPENELLAPRKEATAQSYKGKVVPYHPAKHPPELEELYMGLAHVADEADVPHGVALLESYIRRRPDVFEAAYMCGLGLVMMGRLDEAHTQLTRAAEIMPGNVHVHMSLGDLYEAQKKFPESIAAYERAVQLQPNLARAHNGLGAVHYNAGNLDAAIKSFQTAMTCDPFDDKPHTNLAGIYYQRGDLKAAEAANRAGLTINPSLDDGWYRLSQYVGGQGRHAEAAWYAAEAFRVKPTTDAYFQVLTGIIMQMGPSQREPALRQMFERMPFVARALLSAHFHQTGQKEKAARLLAEAAAVPRSGNAAIIYAGNVAVETGLHETAQQWFKTILETSPEHAEAIVGLAASLRGGGSEPEAEKLLVEKIGTNPQPDPQLLNALAWLRATAKTDGLRNGAQAEQMARRAAGALQGENFLVQRSLAAALAEQGKFQDAAKIAEDAIAIANAAGRQSDANEIRIQLESYRAGKPFRAER